MTTHKHFYFYDPKAVNLAAMQKDALRASLGTGGETPRNVTIHYHKHGDRCENKQHEDFYVPQTLEKK